MDLDKQIRNANKHRAWKNWFFTKMITFSGWLVLLTLGLLVWHLLTQVSPMFGSPTLQLQQQVSLPANQHLLHMQNLSQGRFIVTQDQQCSLHFLTLSKQQLTGFKTVPGLCTDEVKVLAANEQNYLVRLSASGIVRVELVSRTPNDIEHPLLLSLALNEDARFSRPLSWDVQIGQHAIMFSIRQDDRWRVFWVDKHNPSRIKQEAIEQASHLVLLPQINQFVYVDKQQLFSHEIGQSRTHQKQLAGKVGRLLPFENQRAFMLAYQDGQVQKWGLLNRQGQLIFSPHYHLTLPGKLQHLQTHRDENAALLVDEKHRMFLLNHVSGEVVASFASNPAFASLVWINNDLFGADGQTVNRWSMSNLSAVNTFSVLWEGTQYQGYANKEFVWQTTYAQDYQESKYSIVPLVVGSLKASVLSLLIAVPLALMSAIYTGYFAPRRLRSWVKPSIELLEAIPSVVLGFIAAIWLAPLAEQFLLSFALFILLIPLNIMIFSVVYPAIVRRLPWHVSDGWELLIVALLLIMTAWLVGVFNTYSPSVHWLSVTYLADMNKSTLVVALAMGLAITPSIYSLAEDAIFDVPASYKKASFALGASRLQTLRKVVLTLAYPGILSAVVLGLGRAFGETMIVLMVTGNTPVANWDLLAGIRALTANLAIELPEADVTSSHYQILFLTALLLFVFTFVINTLAEILRQWVRRNYQHG